MNRISALFSTLIGIRSFDLTFVWMEIVGSECLDGF